MKIKCNDEVVFELNDTMKKVICNDLIEDEFEQDMKRRARYIIEHKFQQCYKRLIEEWCIDHDGSGSKLAKNGIKSIPTHSQELAELILSQPNYKCRKTRELEQKENIEAIAAP
jgi:hypothetical protein